MSTATETLLTAEQYRLLPDDGRHTELVRGKVVEMIMPAPRHGYFCNKVGRILGNFVEEHDLGRVMNNDSGVITERDPDTVRGADVCFYSYKKIPKGPLPDGYLSVVPELVFEVRSPTDRWSKVISKVGEYLNAGVSVVCVLDTQTETLTVYPADELQRVLTTDDELLLPAILGPEFRIPVRRLFE
jgi:Uma2 family endonuclease